MRRIFLITALLLLPCAPASASNSTASTFQVYWENDVIADTDQHYTNAVKLTWLSPDLGRYRDDPRLPGFLLPLIEALPFVNEPGYVHNVGISLGQSMYTPEDIEDDEVVKGDRPYAGHAYAALALHAKNAARLDTFEIGLGVVGPGSYARQTQRGVHTVIGSPQPKGWDNQLSHEPALSLAWQHSIRARSYSLEAYPGAELVHRLLGDADLELDLIPRYGLTLGNVMTFAGAGATARLGFNLPEDFGASLIAPAGGVLAPAKDEGPRLRDRPVSLYGFVTAEARLVGRNLFLDGNTFARSHRVDRLPVVGDLGLGLSLGVGRFSASYTTVFRSAEFAEQNGFGQVFGSLSLAWVF